jgi:ribonuclease P protein component
VKRLDSTLGYIRVAIVVPKFGFTAARRNKLKRRLRELTREHVLTRSASCDVLVRARRDAYDASFDRLRDDVGHLALQIDHAGSSHDGAAPPPSAR